MMFLFFRAVLAVGFIAVMSAYAYGVSGYTLQGKMTGFLSREQCEEAGRNLKMVIADMPHMSFTYSCGR